MQKRVTYHEAGHAVADVLLGLPFVRVSMEMKEKDEVQNGVRVTRSYTDGIVWDEPRKKATGEHVENGFLDLREALSFMAGMKAEEMVVGKIDDECFRGAAMDIDYVQYCCHHALSMGTLTSLPGLKDLEADLLAVLYAQAETLLRAHWDSVAAVADGLNKHRCLTFQQVVDIMRKKTPEGAVDWKSGFFKGARGETDAA